MEPEDIEDYILNHGITGDEAEKMRAYAEKLRAYKESDKLTVFFITKSWKKDYSVS
jgi:ribosome biogenesis SPOUT family RNA methylase Rps3